MKIFFAAVILLTINSCSKEKKVDDTLEPGNSLRCGVILSTPVLDSFIYPTYYITADVKFPDSSKTIHYHDNVAGDHDGSWYLPKYSKDSTICLKPN